MLLQYRAAPTHATDAASYMAEWDLAVRSAQLQVQICIWEKRFLRDSWLSDELSLVVINSATFYFKGGHITRCLVGN